MYSFFFPGRRGISKLKQTTDSRTKPTKHNKRLTATNLIVYCILVSYVVLHNTIDLSYLLLKHFQSVCFDP